MIRTKWPSKRINNTVLAKNVTTDINNYFAVYQIPNI